MSYVDINLAAKLLKTQLLEDFGQNGEIDFDRAVHHIYGESEGFLYQSRIQTIQKVVIPSSLPRLYDMCRIELAGAWALTIMVEVVASNFGLGHRLVLAQRFLQTANIFALLVIMGIIGFTIDYLFKKNYVFATAFSLSVFADFH